MKSKALLKKERYQESLNFAIQGKKLFHEWYTVLKRKEEVQGRESEEFLSYFTEIMKVFNQVGMGLMNNEKIKESQHLFKALIAFLSAFEVRCG